MIASSVTITSSTVRSIAQLRFVERHARGLLHLDREVDRIEAIELEVFDQAGARLDYRRIELEQLLHHELDFAQDLGSRGLLHRTECTLVIGRLISSRVRHGWPPAGPQAISPGARARVLASVLPGGDGRAQHGRPGSRREGEGDRPHARRGRLGRKRVAIRGARSARGLPRARARRTRRRQVPHDRRRSPVALRRDDARQRELRPGHLLLRRVYLEESLRTGKPAGLKVFGNWDTIYEGVTELPPAAQKSWFEFDHYYSDAAFPLAFPRVFAQPPKKLLDVGANTGKWALHCLQSDPDVDITALDHPEPARPTRPERSRCRRGITRSYDADELARSHARVSGRASTSCG